MSEGSPRPQFDSVSYADWRDRVERDLGGPIQVLEVPGDSVSLQPLYTAEHLPGTPGVQRADVGARVVAAVDSADLPSAAAQAKAAGAAALVVEGAVDPAELAGLPLPVILHGGDPSALGRLDGVVGAEFCFDPVGRFASAGSARWDEGELEALLATTARHEGPCAVRPIYVDVTRYHEAGASAADEIACALATAVFYLRLLDRAGLGLEGLPSRMRFAFSCDADVFGSVSKLRGARLVWAKVLASLGAAQSTMYVHAFQSRRALTALDPLMGVARGCAAGFAAIIGGAQDITLAPHEPTDAGSRLALTTEALLREESHLAEVADPGGGGYYIEARTDALARAAWGRFQEIERSGGMLKALSAGAVQQWVEQNAVSRAGQLRTRAKHLVGVTRYPSTAEMRGELRASRASAPAPDGRTICRPLSPARDAAPYERLRRRAQALPDSRRRAWVVTLGQGRRLGAQVEVARELLEMAGQRVEVVPSAEISQQTPPATAVVCSAEVHARDVIRELRGAGVENLSVSHSGSPDDEAVADMPIVVGMDVLTWIEWLIGRLEDRS